MLKRKEFYGFLLGKVFREKCEHIELALNFIQNSNLVQKTIFLSV